MRHEALAKDLTMNEHGLYSLISKKKGEKVDHIFSSEQDIFDYLGLEYKAPHERTDGRAVSKATVSKATVSAATVSAATVSAATVSKATVQKSAASNEEAKEKEEEPQINETIKNQIQNFKKNGINVLHNMSEHELTEMIKLANILYRNFQPIMTDNEYEILQDYITEKYPSNQ